MTSFNIFLDKNYVGRTCINQVIAAYNKIKAAPSIATSIKIEAINNTVIEDIDLLLIGYLILIKEEIENIDISIIFPFNKPKEGGEDRIESKLIQAAVYAYLMTGKKIFTLIYGNRIPTTDFTRLTNFEKNEFVLSQSFMLFLFVSKQKESLYKLLFIDPNPKTKKVNFNELYKGIAWNKSSPVLYSAYKEQVKKSVNAQNTDDCILSLGALAFLNCLNEASILSIYANENVLRNNLDVLKDVKTGNLSSEISAGEAKRIYHNLEFYNKISSIFYSIADKPLIYQFVFSTLVTEMLPNVINHQTKDNYIKKIHSLWDFTKDLVHGLMELAKNIRDHSSTQKGIIMATVVKKEMINEIKKLLPHEVEHYNDCLNGSGIEIEKYLNIHVFDLSEKGILPTLHEKTKELISIEKIDDSVKELLIADIEAIEKNEVNLENFFSTDHILHQQTKRSLAHFGLIIFNELIEKNNGLVAISSIEMDGNIAASSPKNPVFLQKYQAIQQGTHFDVIMPIDVIRIYTPHIPQDAPRIFTEKELHSIESLLNFNILSLPLLKNYENSLNNKTVLSYIFPEIQVNDRNTEGVLRNKYESVLLNLNNLDSIDHPIFHLSFENVKGINASQLMRFLAYCESRYPRHSCIISHIRHDVLIELININTSYYKLMPKLGYWNSRSPTIIFSSVTDPNTNNADFYFTDILWGHTPQDFLKINKGLSRSHHNSVSMLTTELNLENFDVSGNELSIDSEIVSPLFTSTGTMLAIDLLVKHSKNQSIFENNANYLLNQPL